jgi:hypothetical protein
MLYRRKMDGALELAVPGSGTFHTLCSMQRHHGEWPAHSEPTGGRDAARIRSRIVPIGAERHEPGSSAALAGFSAQGRFELQNGEVECGYWLLVLLVSDHTGSPPRGLISNLVS